MQYFECDLEYTSVQDDFITYKCFYYRNDQKSLMEA